MRERIIQLETTGHVTTPEATPAEGTTYCKEDRFGVRRAAHHAGLSRSAGGSRTTFQAQEVPTGQATNGPALPMVSALVENLLRPDRLQVPLHHGTPISSARSRLPGR